MARNKDRLYITLYHRYEQPGYHWAFLLAPKDPGRGRRKTEVKDSTRWDLTNPQPMRWLFRTAQIDQYTSASLIARVLVAKFNAKNRASIIALLQAKFELVELRQNDPSFDCEVWALNAARALMDQNIIRLSIPHHELRATARAHATHSMTEILAGRLVIEDQEDIPVLDLRSPE